MNNFFLCTPVALLPITHIVMSQPFNPLNPSEGDLRILSQESLSPPLGGRGGFKVTYG